MRTCKVCGEDFPLENFPKISSSPVRYRYDCKPCYRIKHKAYRDANIEKFREQWRANTKKHSAKPETVLKRRVAGYGITVEEYETMLARQSGMCKICKSNEVQVIDHCHSSKKVRGLLCTPCNLMLGNAKDSVDTLKAAVLYLSTAG
jgi:hypothetical protein